VEVDDVAFPELLDPVDDLPPSTVITHVRRDGERIVVRGTAADNGPIERVQVNDVAAQASAANFAEWEATLGAQSTSTDGRVKLRAHAVDSAGNAEPRPHVVLGAWSTDTTVSKGRSERAPPAMKLPPRIRCA
jgi:hypothetical protein